MNYFRKDLAKPLQLTMLIAVVSVWFAASTSHEPCSGKTLCAEHTIRNRVDAMLLCVLTANDAMLEDSAPAEEIVEPPPPGQAWYSAQEPPLPGESWSTLPPSVEWQDQISSGQLTNYVIQASEQNRGVIAEVEHLLDEWSHPIEDHCVQVRQAPGECYQCFLERSPNISWGMPLPETVCCNAIGSMEKTSNDLVQATARFLSNANVKTGQRACLNEANESYSAAQTFRTDVFAVSLENSLQYASKWLWDGYVYVCLGWPNATDNPPTNLVSQAAEQNRDTIIQNVEAILEADPKGTRILGLGHFEAYDPLSELLADISDPSRVAARSAKTIDESNLELTRLVILYLYNDRD